MKRRRGGEAPSHFGPEEIERRSRDVPSAEFRPGSTRGRDTTVGFSDCDDTIRVIRSSKTAVPGSIEYLSNQYRARSKFDVFSDEDAERTAVEAGSRISRRIRETFAPELDGGGEEPPALRDLAAAPEMPREELAGLNLASEERVQELTRLHMALYSVLSRIQEVRIVNDLRDAYDIQDRIAYVLDNRSLLLEPLVDELIKYLGDMVVKMADCADEIRLKQAKFNDLNSRVSRLKEYRYKTDPSVRLLEDNRALAESEIERNLKILGDGKSG